MNRIKFLRSQHSLSQIEVALATGIPRYVIQLAEQGLRMPCQEHLEALANLFNLSSQDELVKRLPNNEQVKNGDI